MVMMMVMVIAIMYCLGFSVKSVGVHSRRNPGYGVTRKVCINWPDTSVITVRESSREHPACLGIIDRSILTFNSTLSVSGNGITVYSGLSVIAIRRFIGIAYLVMSVTK